MEIYDRPANRFVATFVGTPSMNFLPSSALSQSVEPPRADLIVGIRPEDLVPDTAGPVHMRITLVEPTGGESFVHGEAEHGKLVARTGGYADLRAGEEVRYSFDPRKAHLFDRTTGSRVET